MKTNKKELEKINHEFMYCGNWGQRDIEDVDVQIANKYIEAIEGSRTKDTPKAGDILELTNKHGDYYGNAHIDRITTDDNGEIVAEICEQAYTPFISLNNGEIRFSTSGGAWCSLPIKKFIYKGTRQKKFCDWGHCGAEAHGAIDFIAEVNVWECVEDGALYGNYSTKQFTKEYITILDEEAQERRQTNYKILGHGSGGTASRAWETEEEYNNYKEIFNGVEFEQNTWGNCKNFVLFTYKKEYFYNMDEYKFESLALPAYVIRHNGSKYIAKVAKDDTNKITFVYLCESYKIPFENNFEEWRRIKDWSKYEGGLI